MIKNRSPVCIADMTINIHELKAYLQTKINSLSGAWINKNSGYEQLVCDKLGFTCQTSRYWDCVYNGLYIEVKKGKSIWLDEIRYAEQISIQTNTSIDLPIDNKFQKTITIFLIHNKDKTAISNIYVIDTDKLIKFMNITPEWAISLIARRKDVKRCLNCQQSMTVKDLAQIADYVVGVT